MTLPDTKNTPGLDPLNKKTILYGPQKIGKTTLISKLYPNAAFIATDPSGHEELAIYSADCQDWTTFRRIGQEIAQYLAAVPEGEDPIYDAICVDTVDELVRLCRQHVLAGLSGGPTNKKPDDFIHESDWDYGKAWNAVAEEFRLRVAKLCNLGLPVVFISHSKVQTKKTRVGQEVTVHSPDVGSGALREWLLKFVDYIFFAEMLQTPEGEQRILHTAPSETYHAGYRWPEGKAPLPEPLPLDGGRLRAALSAAASQPAPGDVMEAAGEAAREPKEANRHGDEARRPSRENGKAEPKTVQDARKVIAAIDEERVKESGYNVKESKALNTVAKYEAKQKEGAAA